MKRDIEPHVYDHEDIQDAQDRAMNEAVEEREGEQDDEKYREHMARMLRHGLEWINDNAAKTNACEHKYAEQETAPLGVKCVRCGHFVGAWE